jgi:hypothetical protein
MCYWCFRAVSFYRLHLTFVMQTKLLTAALFAFVLLRRTFSSLRCSTVLTAALTRAISSMESAKCVLIATVFFQN